MRLERLEDRLALAHFTVLTTADSGSGSLREAIDLANVNGSPDTIEFHSSLAGQSIELSTVANSDFGPSALAVTTPITITRLTSGNGVTITRSGSAGDMRLLYVSSTGSLTLENLTLTGGAIRGGDGGNGDNGGGGGGGAGLGGAIFNAGTLSIVSSTLVSNSATGGNGGGGGALESGGGGGMAGDGDDGLFSGGDGGAGGGGDGGSSFAGSGTDGTFGGGGGGGGPGGGSGGDGGDGGFGGGGGGSGVTFGTNGTPGAGGFGGGDGAIPQGSSSNAGGGAGLGGAIFNDAGAVTLTNSTLSGNMAVGGLGANNGSGLGGAIFNRAGMVTLVSSTVANNAVSNGSVAGGGVYSYDDGLTASLELVNSIVANSTGAADIVAFGTGTSVLTASAPNIVESLSVSGTTTSDTSGVAMVDPQLVLLASNGGPTQTHALAGTSPAVNAGDNTDAAGLTNDQRGAGFVRIAGADVDLGAFELQSDVAVTSIERFFPFEEIVYDVSVVVFLVSFEQAVSGVDADNFALDGAAAGSAAFDVLISTDGGVTWLVPVLIAPSAEGTLQLDLVNTNGIVDGGLAPLVPSTFTTGESYEIVEHITYLATGTDTGGGPHVKVFTPCSCTLVYSFFAFNPAWSGGVRVAVGDVNGDGYDDIIAAAGPGGGPHVKIFSGQDLTLLAQVMAYDINFTGGVYVGVGNFDDDLALEVITGAGAGGGPNVRVWNVDTSSGTLVPLPGFLGNFYAYSSNFTGGVTVAGGNFDGSGIDEVITGAGPGGGPNVRVFNSAGTMLANFYAYDAAFTGGVYVTAGDLDFDGFAEIITGPGSGMGPQVNIFNDGNGVPEAAFFAYNPLFTGGVRVGILDADGDGYLDILTGPGPTGGPHVRVWDGLFLFEIDDFFAYSAAFRGGIFVAGSP